MVNFAPFGVRLVVALRRVLFGLAGTHNFVHNRLAMAIAHNIVYVANGGLLMRKRKSPGPPGNMNADDPVILKRVVLSVPTSLWRAIRVAAATHDETIAGYIARTLKEHTPNA